jgi:hypothetical protein
MRILVPIIVALIGLAGSIGSAFVVAKATTKREIVEERNQLSGGTVSGSGSIVNRVGRRYKVEHSQTGVYKIQFDEPFARKPVALAVPHREKDSAVGIVRVMDIDERSLTVTTRHFRDNTTINAPFSFMVLESIESFPAE